MSDLQYDYAHLVGQKYEFEDGCSIKIRQIKEREDGPWATFMIQNGPGIPRMESMLLTEFLQRYSHLFEQKS